MNKTQLQTVITAIAGVIATWLATKFPLLDPATWNTLVLTVVGAVVTIVIGLITGNTSLKDTVGNMAATTVVTDPASAAALPNNPSVVSNTEAKVVDTSSGQKIN